MLVNKISECVDHPSVRAGLNLRIASKMKGSQCTVC